MTPIDTMPITPSMKVSTLLDEYPQLVRAFTELAPAFRRLKNPELFKAVARVTTLERAAGIAEIPVQDMVLKLRSVVGQPAEKNDETTLPASSACGCFDPAHNQKITLSVRGT